MAKNTKFGSQSQFKLGSSEQTNLNQQAKKKLISTHLRDPSQVAASKPSCFDSLGSLTDKQSHLSIEETMYQHLRDQTN